MNISSISSGNGLSSFSASAGSTYGNTTTVTRLADGSSVSTVRAPDSAVVAVTTSAVASPYLNASADSYGIDITA